MIRKIIHINEEKCNGCGLCATACHEGAIGMINGKAKLLRDDYCDGLGDCLPACPTEAISFVTREADAYDEAAVKANQAPSGKEGAAAQKQAAARTETPVQTTSAPDSELVQWPVQIRLVPPNAPYFDKGDLLIAADCTAFSRADFHSRFMRNRITLIGCPKLDDVDYSEKLTEIIKRNDLKSITVVRMEVPCCGGIVHAVSAAIKASGKDISFHIVTLSTTGELI